MVIVIRSARCRLAHLSAVSRNTLAMAQSWHDRLVWRRYCCAGTMTSVCCGCLQSAKYKSHHSAWRLLEGCLTSTTTNASLARPVLTDGLALDRVVVAGIARLDVSAAKSGHHLLCVCMVIHRRWSLWKADSHYLQYQEFFNIWDTKITNTKCCEQL